MVEVRRDQRHRCLGCDEIEQQSTRPCSAARGCRRAVTSAARSHLTARRRAYDVAERAHREPGVPDAHDHCLVQDGRRGRHPRISGRRSLASDRHGGAEERLRTGPGHRVGRLSPRLRLGRDRTGPVRVQSRAPVNDNQWHHVALVVDINTLTLYVDGTQDGGPADQMNANPANGAGPFTMLPGRLHQQPDRDRVLERAEGAGVPGRQADGTSTTACWTMCASMAALSGQVRCKPWPHTRCSIAILERVQAARRATGRSRARRQRYPSR